MFKIYADLYMIVIVQVVFFAKIRNGKKQINSITLINKSQQQLHTFGKNGGSYICKMYYITDAYNKWFPVITTACQDRQYSSMS